MTQYLYMLKLHDGRLLRAEGADPADAMRAARVKPEQVKRHMPICVVVPLAEQREKERARNERLRQARKVLLDERRITERINERRKAKP